AEREGRAGGGGKDAKAGQAPADHGGGGGGAGGLIRQGLGAPPRLYLSPAVPIHFPYFDRRISRMSNTGQSGAVLPEHRVTVLVSKRSSFLRSPSFPLMSSTWCAA